MIFTSNIVNLNEFNKINKNQNLNESSWGIKTCYIKNLTKMSDGSQSLASKKAVFHALKYISSDVVGLLTSKDANPTLKNCDAYPLSHTRITSPQITIGLEILDDKILENNDKDRVVGIYESYTNYEFKEENYVSPITMRMAEVLREKYILEKVIIVTYQFDSTVPSKSQLSNNLLEKLQDRQNQNFDEELPEEAFKGANSAIEYDMLKRGVLKVSEYEFTGSDTLKLKNKVNFDSKSIESEIKSNKYWNIIDVENHLEDASLCLKNKWVTN